MTAADRYGQTSLLVRHRSCAERRWVGADQASALDVRETAECHLEAFKLRPGLTETDLEVQAAFMDICMAARGYAFLPGCTEVTPNAGRTYNLGYKFNSICWRKN
jgi:hypothetical protein